MIALLAAAFAAPRPADLERYLDWYAAGERERLWEAASDRYRDEICGGRPEDCPRLDGVALGNPVLRRISCDRRRCTLVRHDTYATPPLPWSETTELDWIVTSDLAGRFEGVAIDFDEPGASARTLGWFLGLGCAILATLVAGWAALFVLLRVGSRSHVAASAEATPPGARQ